MGLWLDTLYWIEKHPGLAAWVQATGALVALAIAIGVPLWQKKVAARLLQDSQKAQLRRLLLNLRDEIALTSEWFHKENGTMLLGSQPGTPFHVTIPLLEYPFPIYDSLLADLGAIEDDGLRHLVITAYGRATGFAASIRFNNKLIDQFEQAEYMANIRGDNLHNELRDRTQFVFASYGDALRSSYGLAREEVGKMQQAISEALRNLQ